MSILVGGVRPARRGGTPSVREVCLVGIARPASGWASGDRVTFSGRVYRVEATGTRSSLEDEAPRYVHLAAVAAD